MNKDFPGIPGNTGNTSNITNLAFLMKAGLSRYTEATRDDTFNVQQAIAAIQSVVQYIDSGFGDPKP